MKNLTLERVAVCATCAAVLSVFMAGVAVAQSVPPTAPIGLTATFVPPSQISISWTAPSTTTTPIAGYYVYRNGAMLSSTPGTTFTDSVGPGLYTYTVAAYGTPGNVMPQSAPSSPIAVVPDTVPPSKPTALTITGLSSSSVSLSWTAATDTVGVAGYYLIRDSSRLSTTTAITGTTFTDTGLYPQTAHSYAVEAYDAAGNISGISNMVQITTLPAIFTISQPYNLTVSPISTTEIDLSWGASIDNAGTPFYYIMRNGAVLASTSATTYADTGLMPGTTYGYSVMGIDDAGHTSNPSDTMGTSTLPLPPPAATTSTASTGGTSGSGTTGGTTGITTTFTTTLAYGSRGAMVAALQNILIGQGYLPAGNNSGFFGKLTQTAVQQFQCVKNIVCSGGPQSTGWGVVGAKTRKVLNGQ